MEHVVPFRTRTLWNQMLGHAPEFIHGVTLAWPYDARHCTDKRRSVVAGQAAFWVWTVGAMATRQPS